MIRTGDAWRIVALPRSIADTQANTGSDGFFFRGALAQRATGEVPVADGLSKEVQDLISALEQIDRDLAAANTPAAIAPLNAQKADVLEKLVKVVTAPEDKAVWVRQLAETLSASVQTGGIPGGIQRLEALYQGLQAENGSARTPVLRQVRVPLGRLQARPCSSPARICQGPAEMAGGLGTVRQGLPHHRRHSRSHAAAGLR